jgi:quercetin dioxygenase-like cupin family protein
MKTKSRVALALMLGMALLSPQAMSQDAFGFFRGETFPPPRTTPAAWLMELHKADDLFGSNIAVATFLPNTRLAWHNHPGGQILVVTDGVGYYQEKGQAKQILRLGDVVKCAPGVEHWHGAAVESGFTYVAISPAQKGPTVWAQAVTDDEYQSIATDRRSSAKPRKAGSATLVELAKADSVFPFNVISVTFAPGKRLDWHKDPGGQILIFTDGSGYYQERGQAKQLLHKGDVVKSAAGIEHWHGAAAEIGATHIAITPVKEPGTQWLEKVTDKDYGAEAVAPARKPE